MEDLPILLLFLSIYLIAASSGSKKKKRGKKNAPVYPGASEQRSAMPLQATLRERRSCSPRPFPYGNRA